LRIKKKSDIDPWYKSKIVIESRERKQLFKEKELQQP
jgi:hypothetical protein